MEAGDVDLKHLAEPAFPDFWTRGEEAGESLISEEREKKEVGWQNMLCVLVAHLTRANWAWFHQDLVNTIACVS